MKVKILASTMPGHIIEREDALAFGAKQAGICYMPDDYEAIQNEPQEKTMARIEQTLISGHHSVYDHPTYNLLLVDIPKMLAMILNNEGMYTTSEKSARYTKMRPSPKETVLYDEWITIFKNVIKNEYGSRLTPIQIKKLAGENARYLISVFTPTTMAYTVSLRQLNYIISWFEKYISDAEDNDFNRILKPHMQEFVDCMQNLKVLRLNADVKERGVSLFDNRQKRKEYFGEVYSVSYDGTFAQLAQAQRHRTLRYKMSWLPKNNYYVPEIIKNNSKLEEKWLHDISSLRDVYPQGMQVVINERGTYEDFILKCKERLCGQAQLEIANRTKQTLEKYLAATKASNPEVYNYLLRYSKGARCTFPGWKCTSPCVWGANEAFTRKI